jgi:hypothetical protein
MNRPGCVRVMLEVGIPTVSPAEREEVKPLSIEDRVRDAIDMIDSGRHSSVQWIMLNKVYKSLSPRRGKSRRIDNLLNMIEPVMAKYGYHKVSSEG